MEEVKEAAAYYFTQNSRHSFHEMYEAVLAVVEQARGLYADKEAVASIDDDAEFAAMMFRDGCFLLQCMDTNVCSNVTAKWLRSLFFSNGACIRDIMLLENQLPWVVLETLMRFRPAESGGFADVGGFIDVGAFITLMGEDLQGPRGRGRKPPLVMDATSYVPPHLLGLLRFYVTGEAPAAGRLGPASASSIGAIELAEIGIKLAANKTAEFVDMGLRRGLLFGELRLAPLFLDHTRACWLVNMAAFEVCTAISPRQDDEKTAVCSYLAVLAMLMDREEDVHELRTKGLVKGQLSNREMLDFFKNLTKHMSGGSLYARTLEDIEDYKQGRWLRNKVHDFVYNNFTTIVAVLSIVGVVAGIFKMLISLKKH